MNFYTFPKDFLGAFVHTKDILTEKPWNFYTKSCKSKENPRI